MLTRWQRALALLHFLRRPTRAFLPVLLGFLLLVLAGGLAFHRLYDAEPLSLSRALYITYALVFMEHLLPFPDHWLLRLLYVALPPLGLAVILDGIMQYSLRILRRDGTSPDWNHAMAKTLRDHVILCGLGKAGIRTLQTLLELGRQVCVLEKNPECPNLAWARQRGVPVVVSTGRHAGVFEHLGVATARSIVLATDDDLANIEMALDARKLRPDIQVVLRVFDQELAQKIRSSFDIPVALSTTALAAPLFATASCDPSIVHAFYLGDRLYVLARIEISGLAHATVSALNEAEPVHVLELTRAGETRLSPPPSTRLHQGDVMVVQTAPTGLEALHRRNRAAPPQRQPAEGGGGPTWGASPEDGTSPSKSSSKKSAGSSAGESASKA